MARTTVWLGVAEWDVCDCMSASVLRECVSPCRCECDHVCRWVCTGVSVCLCVYVSLCMCV